MDCHLALPNEIKGLLSAGFYSDETKSSALDDFLEDQKIELEGFIHRYVHDGATFVDDSLDLGGVELEGTQGVLSLTFYEALLLNCKDLDKMDDRWVEIRFDLTADEIILHDDTYPHKPER
jgi:hypothetical protein